MGIRRSLACSEVQTRSVTRGDDDLKLGHQTVDPPEHQTARTPERLTAEARQIASRRSSTLQSQSHRSQYLLHRPSRRVAADPNVERRTCAVVRKEREAVQVLVVGPLDELEWSNLASRDGRRSSAARPFHLPRKGRSIGRTKATRVIIVGVYRARHASKSRSRLAGMAARSFVSV